MLLRGPPVFYYLVGGKFWRRKHRPDKISPGQRFAWTKKPQESCYRNYNNSPFNLHSCEILLFTNLVTAPLYLRLYSKAAADSSRAFCRFFMRFLGNSNRQLAIKITSLFKSHSIQFEQQAVFLQALISPGDFLSSGWCFLRWCFLLWCFLLWCFLRVVFSFGGVFFGWCLDIYRL